jgi:hypothetical protein
MTQKQVGQVHGKERVPGRPALFRGRPFVMKPTSVESTQGLGIGPVFVGEDRRHAACGHATSEELLDTLPGGLGIGTSMCFLEQGPFLLLSRPHRAAPTQLGLTHSINEMRCSHEQVQVEGPVLAVLEGPEAVENQGFARGRFGAKLFMEEQAVATEAFCLVLKRAVRDTELTADLAKTGSPDEAVEEGFQQVGVSQPVAGGEGL